MQILSFMASLDTPEVHGFRPDLGYRVYIDKALEKRQRPGEGVTHWLKQSRAG